MCRKKTLNSRLFIVIRSGHYSLCLTPDQFISDQFISPDAQLPLDYKLNENARQFNHLMVIKAPGSRDSGNEMKMSSVQVENIVTSSHCIWRQIR